MSKLTISSFTTHRGEVCSVELAYRDVGPTTAPTVLVCHALTGNSEVVGPDGWWADLIGPGSTIDTDHYRVIAFDIPGNGHDSTPELSDPETFDLHDVARLFVLGLEQLQITHLYALIGPSMGGAIAWQIAALRPELTEHLFPICTDYRASDWLLAQTLVQENILSSSPTPLHDARIHAMLSYRTPESIIRRFAGKGAEGIDTRPASIDWLEYHGRTLEQRFLLSAYRVMTHLTKSIHVADDPTGLAAITAQIHLVSIDSDLLFPHFRTLETARALEQQGQQVTLDTLHSIHGHDAFLIEYPQLREIVAPYFPKNKTTHGHSIPPHQHALSPQA